MEAISHEGDIALQDHAQGRRLRRAYGLDEVALVPGTVAIDPDDVSISTEIGEVSLSIPILGSAMDSAVDSHTAIGLSSLGGLAILNLDGLQARYDNPSEALERIIKAPQEDAVGVIRDVYSKPPSTALIAQRVQNIKSAGAKLGVASPPGRALELLPAAVEAGADVSVIQSTITTAQFISSTRPPLPWEKIRDIVTTPLILGNCVTYEAAMELMNLGADGILIGLGPGAACTTRKVIGVGVPQATAINDVAAARDDFEKNNGTHIALIADGGMRTGADIAKAIALGADAIMLGSVLASREGAPGGGFHWGMATPDVGLPRGTRIWLGPLASLETILMGPAVSDDGTLNLMGALRNAMGVCGAKKIREMHKTEIVIAPAIQTEGKRLQLDQGVGHGR